MKKLHNELNEILGPDESLTIERYNTHPAPKRNVIKEYFDNVIKEYMGIAKVNKNKQDKSIETIKKYLGNRDKYTTSEVREFVNQSRDIPKKLVNTIVRTLNGKSELNPLSDRERELLWDLHREFNIKSSQVLRNNVKYKQNILFHLLQKIGKEPDMNDFSLLGSESVKKTDEEIKKLFDKLGSEFTPI